MKQSTAKLSKKSCKNNKYLENPEKTWVKLLENRKSFTNPGKLAKTQETIEKLDKTVGKQEKF